MDVLFTVFSEAMLPGRDFALALAAVLFATTLKAFAGFGFGLAVVPLLSLILPPAEAVPLSLMLDLIGSSQLVPSARKQVDWRSLRLLVPAALIAIPLGVYLLAALPPDGLRIGIALVLMATVALMASGASLPARVPRPAVLGVGGLAGFLSGATAMPGPPVMIYFLARPNPAAVNRASLLVFFVFTDIASIATGLISGVVMAKTMALALMLSPALVLGNLIGHRLFGLAHERHYRNAVLTLLSVIALVTLIEAVAG